MGFRYGKLIVNGRDVKEPISAPEPVVSEINSNETKEEISLRDFIDRSKAAKTSAYLEEITANKDRS